MARTTSAPLIDLVRGMTKADASDLHLVAGSKPMYRVHGRLIAAHDRLVGPGEVQTLLESLAPEAFRARIAERVDLDFAIQLDDQRQSSRFRVNVFTGRGEIGACIRAIPQRVPPIDELSFPQDLAERIVELNSGLVLITGVTGSGKTTTLAALIQMLNARGGHRIITIEQPIEYVFESAGQSIVTQREVGVDVPSFHDGLRSGLRQDPDVLLVGEIRDRETAQLAISAAETGHLIFATLHTADAKGAITRLVDLFPSEMHDDIRTQLSLSLRYVVAQHLLPATTGDRRVLALEVLLTNFAVRSAIRAGKIEMLDSAIQSGRREGMFTLDAYLRMLLDQGRITLDTARSFAKDPSEFGSV
jgi:twitching motility protein PilT